MLEADVGATVAEGFRRRGRWRDGFGRGRSASAPSTGEGSARRWKHGRRLAWRENQGEEGETRRCWSGGSGRRRSAIRIEGVLSGQGRWAGETDVSTSRSWLGKGVVEVSR